jgi:putative membrane protein
MKPLVLALAVLLPLATSAATDPDQKFYKTAAEGGLAEVQLGQLAEDKATDDAVKQFGARMVTDHSAVNQKLEQLAQSKNISLPTSPSVMEMASKTKLEVLSGNTFDKSYIKGMVEDHEQDIALFKKEARSGTDPDAKAFAVATLPTLKEHLKMIRSIAAKDGVSVK